MNYRNASLIFILVAPLGLRAQQEASTLEELCRKTPHIVTVRLSSQSETKTSLRANFVASHWWKGERKGELSFAESTGAHCGSALHGLEIGKEYLLFFDAHRTRLQLVGGQRGILPRTKDIETAVRSLLLTTDTAARARLLAGQLSHKDARIREDAALALANLPGLETSSTLTRALLLTHLDQAMKATHPTILDSLLLANSRVDAHRTATRAWTLALDEEHTERSSLGREILLRKIGSETMLASVPMAMAKTQRSRLLLLNALAATRSPKALPWVEKLLVQKDPTLRREATITMLSLGREPRELSKVVGKELVMQAEILRTRRKQKPRLKAIRPH